MSFDQDAARAFRKRMIQVMNDSALGLLLGTGDELGLFSALAKAGPADSAALADAAGVDERYLREWLDGIVAGGVASYDPDTGHYWLPPEHAACLSYDFGPVNLARNQKMLTMLAGIAPDLRERFRDGGGLGYEHYPRFHALMAEESAATHDAGLLDVVVPAVPGLDELLEAGATVADVGCGAGHAINLLARAYPASTFTGYDISPEAIAAATAEAAEWGVANASFVVRDVAELGEEAAYDVITAFDAIHDQAYPDRVLAGISAALRPGGTFLMVDIKAESGVEGNLGLPWATYLYTISLMHCMSVSLAQPGGAGLGTVWGRQLATRMLQDAGLVGVDALEIRSDPFNYFYVAHKPETIRVPEDAP